MSETNGVKRTMFTWIISGVVAAGLAVSGWVFAYAGRIDTQLDSHEDIVGHIGMVERVEGVEQLLEQKIGTVQADVDEIQADVKVLLQRSQ